jgi:hypothetical protein
MGSSRIIYSSRFEWWLSLLALKLLSTSLKNLIHSPIIQTEDMVKDYVSKIQELETELHQYPSLQTNPRGSKPSLLTPTAGLGGNCTMIDFASDVLPSSKNSCCIDMERLPLDYLLVQFLQHSSYRVVLSLPRQYSK